MKVTIDRDQCTGCSLCWTEYPEVFEEGSEDGLSAIVPGLRVAGNPGVGEVPDALSEKATCAVDECPAGVIHVER